MILGAVLAGGKSSRFGSDKALAEIGGRSLIELATHQLSKWCDYVVVIGREDAPVHSLPDWPEPGLGPLGGLAAALRFAQSKGFETILSVGVDSVALPANLPGLLGTAPAYIADQPVVGLWRAEHCNDVARILRSDGRKSMMSLAQSVRAKVVKLDSSTHNINTPDDLKRVSKVLSEHENGI